MEGVGSIQTTSLRVVEIAREIGQARASFAAILAHAQTTTTVPNTPIGTGSPAALQPVSDASWVHQLPESGRQWAGAIEQVAQEKGIDPRLLAALVWSESGFDATAVSSAGAVGLTQLMPGTAAGLGVNPHDPMDNLRGGAEYIKRQLNNLGRLDLALAAYNAGPGNVQEYGGIPPFPETRIYIQRVIGYYTQLGGQPW